MRKNTQFCIDGRWVDPVALETAEVINPATEELDTPLSLGTGFQGREWGAHGFDEYFEIKSIMAPA